MDIRRILVTGRLYDELAALLPDKRPDKEYRFVAEEELKADDFVWADAYIGFQPAGPFSLANLRWVHSLGAGVDAFLWGREWNRNVLLTRTIGTFGEQIAEYCLSYLLRDAQCHDVYAWYQEQRQWKPIAPKRLGEQRIVIYGTGEIGRRIAETLRLFGVADFIRDCRTNKQGDAQRAKRGRQPAALCRAAAICAHQPPDEKCQCPQRKLQHLVRGEQRMMRHTPGSEHQHDRCQGNDAENQVEPAIDC